MQFTILAIATTPVDTPRHFIAYGGAEFDEESLLQ
jgi:hypothetical protein